MLVRDFKIYRKESNENRFTFLTDKSIRSNAVGAFLHDYEYVDTLSTFGVYDYLVLATGETSASVVLQKSVLWIENKKPATIHNTITLPLTFSKPGDVDVLVMDPVNDWVLKQYGAEFTFQQPTLQLSLHSLYAKGMRDIKIKVKNSKTREVNIFRYVVVENGWELRQNR